MPKRETRDFRIDGLDNLVAHMTQHDAATASEVDGAATGSASEVESEDEDSAGESRGRSTEVRLVVAEDSELASTRSDPKEIAEPPQRAEDVPARPSRKPGPRKKKTSRTRKRSASEPERRAAAVSGSEWRAARTKSTMRLSPEVLQKILVCSATEALEQQIVVEIALRQFFGMEQLSAEMKRDARARAVWAAMSAESVA